METTNNTTALLLRSRMETALMTALIALCAIITVPTAAAPVTMQTFGIFVAVGLLGGRRGTAAVALYLLLGAAGLPVFAGMQAGFGVLFGLTGGYLLGFLAAAVVMWGLEIVWGRSLKALAVSMVLGLLTCYAFGTAWFMTFYTGDGAVTLGSVLALCVVPYVIPDLLKIALALLITRRLQKILNR